MIVRVPTRRLRTSLINVYFTVLGEVPAAFIVPKSGAELKITELLDACRALLPDYKVPIIFYSVEYIAHTASGKPKRLAAKELLRTGKYGHALVAQLPTEDMLETLVLAEINAVCGLGPGLGQLDPDQNFMSLGLNSLKSIVLRDRLASLTGLELPITRKCNHHATPEMGPKKAVSNTHNSRV